IAVWAGAPARRTTPRRPLLGRQLFGRQFLGLGDPTLDAAGEPDFFADIVSGVGTEFGDLRIVEDADVVQLLLNRRRHTGELLQIVRDAARTGQRLEAETLF